MYAEERQGRIVEALHADGRVSVVELAQRLDVTTETIRRDLSALEGLGQLRRVHGGAVTVSRSSRVEESTKRRRDLNADAKARIARTAMRLLPPTFAGAIAVDAGTTTGLLAEEVARWRPQAPNQSFVLITNSVPVAGTVSENPDVEVQLLGGRLRSLTSAAVGTSTLAQLSRMRPDIAFIGANGVHAAFGLSTPDDDESAVKTAFTRGARRAVALVDASKLGEESLVRFAKLSDLDMLITDAEPAPDLRAALDEAEVELVVA